MSAVKVFIVILSLAAVALCSPVGDAEPEALVEASEKEADSKFGFYGNGGYAGYAGYAAVPHAAGVPVAAAVPVASHYPAYTAGWGAYRAPSYYGGYGHGGYSGYGHGGYSGYGHGAYSGYGHGAYSGYGAYPGYGYGYGYPYGAWK